MAYKGKVGDDFGQEGGEYGAFSGQTLEARREHNRIVCIASYRLAGLIKAAGETPQPQGDGEIPDPYFKDNIRRALELEIINDEDATFLYAINTRGNIAKHKWGRDIWKKWCQE